MPYPLVLLNATFEVSRETYQYHLGPRLAALMGEDDLIPQIYYGKRRSRIIWIGPRQVVERLAVGDEVSVFAMSGRSIAVHGRAIVVELVGHDGPTWSLTLETLDEPELVKL